MDSKITWVVLNRPIFKFSNPSHCEIEYLQLAHMARILRFWGIRHDHKISKFRFPIFIDTLAYFLRILMNKNHFSSTFAPPGGIQMNKHLKMCQPCS